MKDARTIAPLSSSAHLKSRSCKDIELRRTATEAGFRGNRRGLWGKGSGNAAIVQCLADRLMHGAITLGRAAMGKRNGPRHNEGKRPISIVIDNTSSGPPSHERATRAHRHDLGQGLRVTEADPWPGPAIHSQYRHGNEGEKSLVEGHLHRAVTRFPIGKDSQRFKTRREFQRHRGRLFRPAGRMARNTGTAD